MQEQEEEEEEDEVEVVPRKYVTPKEIAVRMMKWCVWVRKDEREEILREDTDAEDVDDAEIESTEMAMMDLGERKDTDDEMTQLKSSEFFEEEEEVTAPVTTAAHWTTVKMRTRRKE